MSDAHNQPADSGHVTPAGTPVPPQQDSQSPAPLGAGDAGLRAALPGVRVRVIGVGGGGSNIVDGLIEDAWLSISRVVVNTDAQALNTAKTQEKLLVGRTLTRGLSTGGDPALGQRVAHKDREQLAALVQGQDLVFIVAGLGGGTGSALAPVLAQLAVSSGALVIGFVAQPFAMEGQRPQEVAADAMAALRERCDALLTLPNELMMQHMQEDTTVLDAFAQANAWIARAIHSVSTMVLRTGMMNIDLAALRSAFASGGRTLFGLGRGRGADCVEEALNDLLICPLLNAPEHNHRADRLLLNIVGSKSLGLAAINRILATVTEHFGSREHTLIGAVIDERLEQGVELCVIGTSSLDGHAPRRRRPDAVPQHLSGGHTALATGFGGGAVTAANSTFGNAPSGNAPQGNSGWGNGAQGGSGRGNGAAGQGGDAASGSAGANAYSGGAGQAGGEPHASGYGAAEGQYADGGSNADGVSGAALPPQGDGFGESVELPDGSHVSFSQSMIPGTCEDEPQEGDPYSTGSEALFARDEEFPSAPKASSRPVHDSKLKPRKKPPTRPRTEADAQEEFLFVADGEQRGMFDRTSRNILDGVDLDVPAYERRGIRIVLG